MCVIQNIFKTLWRSSKMLIKWGSNLFYSKKMFRCIHWYIGNILNITIIQFLEPVNIFGYWSQNVLPMEKLSYYYIPQFIFICKVRYWLPRVNFCKLTGNLLKHECLRILTTFTHIIEEAWSQQLLKLQKSIDFDTTKNVSNCKQTSIFCLKV